MKRRYRFGLITGEGYEGPVRGRGEHPPPPPVRVPVSDEPPAVGSIHQATVKRIQPYGLFVELVGFSRHGLVHFSQVRSSVPYNQWTASKASYAV